METGGGGKVSGAVALDASGMREASAADSCKGWRINFSNRGYIIVSATVLHTITIDVGISSLGQLPFAKTGLCMGRESKQGQQGRGAKIDVDARSGEEVCVLYR